MIIVISPAKTFHKNNVLFKSLPLFENDALNLVLKLKKLSINQIISQMKVSLNIANTVYNDYQNFGNSKSAAIFSYDGQAFKGFDISSLNNDHFSYLNKHLYILSGLYGLVRPLDGISKYRLEMKDYSVENLYTFWRDKINTHLNTFHPNEIIINLASKEYSTILNQNNMVTIDFMQVIHDQHRSISMHTKKARGMMARYLIEHQIKTLNQIKTIELDGYRYQKELSTDQKMIFAKVMSL